MNLTLKQLFKFGAVCTCACALSATAADYLADSFEAPEGSEGLIIGEYKTYGDQNQYSNWVAQAGDASAIVTNDPAYADIEGDGPITNATTELILNLETEGNTLSRAVTNALDIETAPAYVDTLIQFTPSEDDPDIDTTDVKVALYVNAQSNLVVVHHMFTAPDGSYGGDYTPILTNSVITSVDPIDPAKWYRLTMKVFGDGLDTFTLIWLDGQLLEHPNAYDYDTDLNGGDHFVNIETGVLDINMISFQGTGLLDELVVTDTMPDVTPPPTAIEITLVAEGGNVTFTPAAMIESGESITMEADDWERIVTVTGAIDQDLSGELPASLVTTTLTADASCTVTVTVDAVSGDYDLGDGTYDAASVAAWAAAYGVTEAEAAGAEDDYLLNVDPADGDATIVITDIVITGATTLTVTVDSSNDNVNFQTLNGTLKLYATDTLGGTWTEVASYSLGTGTVSIDVDVTEAVDLTTDFIKAVVE